METSYCYYFGPFCLDAARRRLTRGGTLVSLTDKAFELLLILVERAGETVSTDELMRKLWSEEATDGTLRQHALMIRRALGETQRDHAYIGTIYGRGYRFIGAVTSGPSPVAQALTEQLCAAAAELRESRSPTLMRGALDLYERALSIDGRSPTALGGSSFILCLIAEYCYQLPRDLLEAARTHAEAALAVDPNCVDALVALSKVQCDADWDLGLSYATIERAAALAPQNRIVAFVKSWLILAQRNFAEAHAYLDTFDYEAPGSDLVRFCRGFAYLYERKYGDAVAELSEACERWPDFWTARTFLGQGLFLSGDAAGALDQLDSVRLSIYDLPPAGQVYVRCVAEAYALFVRFRSGDHAEAEASLERLHRLSRRQFIPATCFALAELGRGHIREAIEYIRECADNRESWYTAIGVDPFADEVRESLGQAPFRQRAK